MDDSESDVPADYVRLGDEGNLGRAMLHQQNSQRSWNSKRKYLGGVLEAWKLGFLCKIFVLRQSLSDWE